MRGFASDVLSCRERERLEEELAEARTRGRNLTRLRRLAPFERAVLEERELAAQARLRSHEMEHGCERHESYPTLRSFQPSSSDDFGMTSPGTGADKEKGYASLRSAAAPKS